LRYACEICRRNKLSLSKTAAAIRYCSPEAALEAIIKMKNNYPSHVLADRGVEALNNLVDRIRAHGTASGTRLFVPESFVDNQLERKVSL